MKILGDTDLKTARLKSALDKIFAGKKYVVKSNIPGHAWMWDSSMNPIVVIHKEEAQAILSGLNKLKGQDLEIYWKDPFLGVIPHEQLEANITLQLLEGKVAEVLKQFPKYKLTTREKEHLDKHTPYPTGWYSKLQNRLDLPSEVEEIGGLAHDIIISPSRRKYNRYVESIPF